MNNPAALVADPAHLSDTRAAFARLLRERIGYAQPLAAILAHDLVDLLQHHQAGRVIPPADASTRRQAMRDLHTAGIGIDTLAQQFTLDRRAVLFSLNRKEPTA